MKMQLTREFSAGGIIIKRFKGDFKVLLIKDGYGRWTWPKGNIERRESSHQAAIREIEEEVGLKKIRIIEKIGQIKYFYKLRGNLIFKTVYLFLFEAIGKESTVPLKSEIQDAKWFDSREALKIIEYKNSRRVLQKAIERYEDVKKEKDTAC